MQSGCGLLPRAAVWLQECGSDCLPDNRDRDRDHQRVGLAARPVARGDSGERAICHPRCHHVHMVGERPHVEVLPSDDTESSAASRDMAQRLAERLREARVEAFLHPERHLDVDDRQSELDRLLLQTAQVYANAVTEQTRSTYARRWRVFTRWCERNDLSSLPATPETVMLFLSDSMKTDGMCSTTMRGFAAAVSRIHLEAGLPSPNRDPGMAMFLRGMSRIALPPKKHHPISALRITGLREVCHVINRDSLDIKEVRDRAILGLIAAGMNGAQIARLAWDDLEMTPKVVEVTIRSIHRTPSTTLSLGALEGDGACPITALYEWRSRTVGDDPLPSATVFTRILRGEVTPDPLTHRRVIQMLHGRRKSLGTPGHWATPEQAMRLLATYRSVDLRDRALLLIGFAGAFRRVEVTELRWGDITPRDNLGIVVHLRHSKTDVTGHGRDVGIPYGKSTLTCPVKALDAWKVRVEQQHGPVTADLPVFVDVGRAGRLGTDSLVPETLTGIVKRRASAAGLEGHWGGRSLRAGFISTAADLEIPLEKVAAQSRHASLDALALYIRRLDPFSSNAANQVGL